MNAPGKIRGKLNREKTAAFLSEMRWLAGYSWKYRLRMVWYALCGLISTGLGLAGSVISKHIIDAVTGADSGGLVLAVAFYVFSQVTSIAMNAAGSRISAKISIDVEQEIRADVYDKVMNADWQAMTRFHSGDIITRVEGDVGTVSGTVLTWLPNLVTRLIQLAGAFFIIFRYDRMLAVLALLTAPISLLLSRVVLPRMKRYNEEMRQMNAEMMVFKEESFHNLESLKSLGLTRAYGEKFRSVQKKYRTMRLDYNAFTILTQALMSGAAMLVGLVCFIWGVYRLWSGAITYGTMTLFLQMASQLSSSFSVLAGMVPGMIQAATAAGRIIAVTELPEEKNEDREASEELLHENPDGMAVFMRGVTFRYAGGGTVFEQADLEARPGRIIGVIGPSGGGKTTLMRLLLGIVAPEEGELYAEGATTGGRLTVSASTRNLFSYVPQGNTMLTGTVAENLRVMDEKAEESRLIEVLRRAGAYDFVAAKPEGLDAKVRERGGGFSEGQIQRLAIARALLSDAPVLLLDEATSALDPETERLVLAGILGFDRTKTVIVTTHRPSVLGSCDAVYRIADGTIREIAREEAVRLMEGQEEK